MGEYYLAIDIGASSGRHILGTIVDGRMQIEEIHRFPNELVEKNGQLCWDVVYLFREILAGLKKCKAFGKIPKSVGIDTWAVDFVLLDGEDRILGNPVGYRDSRTSGMDKKVYQFLSQEELYCRTGIQKQIFNTIYQLMAVKEANPESFRQAKSMLMIPDYFHYLLTGKRAAEYTNATTTQLVSPVTKDWDYELIDMLGYPRNIFPPIQMAGTELGSFRDEIIEEAGFKSKVVLPATHDTGSAVMAVPIRDEKALYISSGTWSLIGTEQLQADCSKESRERNFTNEGGFDYRFRYLKNIMGLWMIQSARKELAPELSFQEICDRAERCRISSIVDANDTRFLAPKSMTEEIKAACKEAGQQVPEGIAETAAVIYNSLASCYEKAVKEIEELTGEKFDRIHVIGGGAQAEYLNQLTANYTKKQVFAGPTEATAIGNLAAQMMADGKFQNLRAVRECIFNSFTVKEYNAR